MGPFGGYQTGSQVSSWGAGTKVLGWACLSEAGGQNGVGAYLAGPWGGSPGAPERYADEFCGGLPVGISVKRKGYRCTSRSEFIPRPLDTRSS